MRYLIAYLLAATAGLILATAAADATHGWRSFGVIPKNWINYRITLRRPGSCQLVGG